MTLSNCTISDNTADKSCGGINLDLATTTLTDCTVSGNSTGGGGSGLAGDGPTTLTNCTVSGNSAGGAGGGLGSFGASATLTNCTFSDNRAKYGGGLWNNGPSTTITTITLTDCTVSGNTSSSSFGGIYLSGTATLANTIVAGNADSSGASDIGGPGTDSGSNNLIGTGGSGGLINLVDGNLVGVANPGLAPLGDYGGPTETMALCGRDLERRQLQLPRSRPDRRLQEIVLQFSEALDSATAQSINSYTLATVPKNKKQKSKPLSYPTRATAPRRSP
jgi:fibronectin-binding autotransporter adhesin